MPKKASVKKESSKPKKIIVKEETKEDIKQDSKKLLTRKVTAMLYFICGACWLISAILYSTTKQIPIFDIILGLLFIGIGILYIIKDKKERENK